MESRLGGPEGNAERARRLGQRQADVIAQDEDGPMLGLKPGHGPIELVAKGEIRQLVHSADEIERTELHLDRPAPAAADQIEARVDGQAVEPGIEPVRVAEAREIAPGADQRLLDRIAGELAVPEDQASGCVQAGDRRARELGEGVMIARLARSTSTRWSTVRSRSARPAWPRSTRYGVAVARFVPQANET
jgi:hypothetical protein